MVPEVTRRPVGRTPALRRLTRNLDALVAAEGNPHVVAPRVGELLVRVLDDPALLEVRHQQPDSYRYRQHVVHVHPEGKYSIVALVWKPGQSTPIHDHCCWCVVGVWEGVERESTYDVVEGADRLSLVPRGETLAVRGDVSVLVPLDEDIHRVENAGAGIAISLHIYGADIQVRGTSINHTFPDELVTTSALVDGVPASWRRLVA